MTAHCTARRRSERRGLLRGGWHRPEYVLALEWSNTLVMRCQRVHKASRYAALARRFGHTSRGDNKAGRRVWSRPAGGRRHTPVRLRGDGAQDAKKRSQASAEGMLVQFRSMRTRRWVRDGGGPRRVRPGLPGERGAVVHGRDQPPAGQGDLPTLQSAAPGAPTFYDYECERNGTSNLLMLFGPLGVGAGSR